jgi:hypothetical protein
MMSFKSSLEVANLEDDQGTPDIEEAPLDVFKLPRLDG